MLLSSVYIIHIDFETPEGKPYIYHRRKYFGITWHMKFEKAHGTRDQMYLNAINDRVSLFVRL